MSMNPNLLKTISEPIFYVTNDVSHGIGLENLLPNYHIVCLDDHPLVDFLQDSGISVFCLERALGKKNELFRQTSSVLAHPLALAFIREKSRGKTANILFFKPQKKLDLLAREYGFNLLGNSSEINRLFEDKIAFYKTCRQSGIKVPEGEVSQLASLKFSRLCQKYSPPLVIQFGRGWAGNTTFFVESSGELEKLKAVWGAIKVKITGYVRGKTVLNNAVVWGDKVLVSRPALQIKTLPCLSACPGATGGRQWPAGVTQEQEKTVKELTLKTGRLMARKGYRGFFGLDFLIAENNEIYVSENNARLTASVPFYTKQELAGGSFPLIGFHLLAFLKKPSPDLSWKAPFIQGSEVVARNNHRFPVKILSAPESGLYNFKLEFRGRAYSLAEAKKDEFWLQSVAAGRVVNPEIEIAKINTREAVSHDQGDLKQEYVNLIKAVLKKIKLKNA